MTQLQSAYPKKFHNQFIFFSTNFVSFHLKETTQSITQIIRILSCHILIYHQISMATPKATNDHFSVKNMKFSRKEFIQPYHRQIRGLDQNCANFVYFQVSRPIPMPPEMKNLQLVEFWPTSAIAHN